MPCALSCDVELRHLMSWRRRLRLPQFIAPVHEFEAHVICFTAYCTRSVSGEGLCRGLLAPSRFPPGFSSQQGRRRDESHDQAGQR